MTVRDVHWQLPAPACDRVWATGAGGYRTKKVD